MSFLVGEVRFPPFLLGGRNPSLQTALRAFFRYPLPGAPQVRVVARVNLRLGGTHAGFLER
jgi:hypothetical protein